jgi:hypothetical protein
MDNQKQAIRIRTELRSMYQELPELRPLLINPAFRKRLGARLVRLLQAAEPTTAAAIEHLESCGYTVLAAADYAALADTERTALSAPAAALDPAARALDSKYHVTWDNHRGRLLKAYSVLGQDHLGLTDEEAAHIAGMPVTSCWWKRCGELRKMGYIAPVPEEDADTYVVRKGAAGVARMVCAITPEGRSALYSMEDV